MSNSAAFLKLPCLHTGETQRGEGQKESWEGCSKQSRHATTDSPLTVHLSFKSNMTGRLVWLSPRNVTIAGEIAFHAHAQGLSHLLSRTARLQMMGPGQRPGSKGRLLPGSPAWSGKTG